LKHAFSLEQVFPVGLALIAAVFEVEFEGVDAL
jgi:hypothetical protein